MSLFNPNEGKFRTGTNHLEEINTNSNSNQPPITYGELYQGVIDCSTNPNYPAATLDMYWKVSVAGMIGGAAGTTVKIGDEIICITTNAGGTEAAVGTDFMIEEGKTYIGVPPTPVVRTNSPIIAANTVNANITALDTAIGVTPIPVITRSNNPIDSTHSVNFNIVELDKAIGADPTSLHYLSVNACVNANLSSLDAALYTLVSFNTLSASINGAGTNQATATVIATGIVVVSLADGTVGVKLPAIAVGKTVTIYNITAAEDLKVYGNAAETVNGAASKKFSHATLVSEVVCTRASATDWLMTAVTGTIS